MTSKRKVAKSKIEKPVYQVYTDGSALGNPGPGGYAGVVTLNNEQTILSEGFFLTTNNRMEIMSVIAVLEEFGPAQEFVIHSDSQYTIDGATKWVKNWKRNNWTSWKTGQTIKNQDLWIVLDELMRSNKVRFVKVKAHSGIPLNELADKEAKKAAGSPTTIDVGFANP